MREVLAQSGPPCIRRPRASTSLPFALCRRRRRRSSRRRRRSHCLSCWPGRGDAFACFGPGIRARADPCAHAASIRPATVPSVAGQSRWWAGACFRAHWLVERARWLVERARSLVERHCHRRACALSVLTRFEGPPRTFFAGRPASSSADRRPSVDFEGMAWGEIAQARRGPHVGLALFRPRAGHPLPGCFPSAPDSVSPMSVTSSICASRPSSPGRRKRRGRASGRALAGLGQRRRRGVPPVSA